MNRGEKYFLSRIVTILWDRGEDAYLEHYLGDIAGRLAAHAALSFEHLIPDLGEETYP